MEMDYSFLKADGQPTTDEADACSTNLSFKDDGTGLGIALAVPSKTYPLTYMIKMCSEFVDRLGHTLVTIRTDNEPSISVVLDGVLRLRNTSEFERTFKEYTPRYSSQSLGSVGVFQRTLNGDVKTLRYQAEAFYGQKFLPTHNVWPWLVRHANFVRGCFT